MTAPGGIPGFGYTDTSVAAKLSLDIPTDSVDILKNVAMYTGEIQASMEAAARFGGDFMSYLQQFPQIQREVLDMQKQTLQVLRDSTAAMDQMRNSSAGMTSMAGFSPQGGNTSQYFNAFSQMSGQQGSDRDNSARSAPQDTSTQQDPNNRDSQITNYVQSMGAPVGYFGPSIPHSPNNGPNVPMHLRSRLGMPPTPGIFNSNNQNDISTSSRQQSEDREDSIDRQRAIRDRSTNPTARIASGLARRRMASAGHRRGTAPDEEEDSGNSNPAPTGDPSAGESDRNTPTPTPEGEHKKGGVMRIANILANSFQGGLNTLGPDGTPVAGRLSLASRVATGIGELSPALKGFGMAGLGIGAGALAFNEVQNIGETIQGYKNMDQHGHTLGGGLGVQKDVMLMSLNPLISTEQSREIIMGALKSGYTGDSYTNAVDFIKDNLVNMNMEVSKSVSLLTNNVELGKQSISGLKMDLGTLATIGAQGQKTNEQVQDQFTKASDYLTKDLGVSGAAASGFGLLVTTTFNNKAGTDKNPVGDNAEAISTGFIKNQSFVSQLHKYSPNSMLANTVKDLAESDPSGKKLSDAIWSTIGDLANQVNNSPESDENKKAIFFQMLPQYNSYFSDPATKNQADYIFDTLTKKGGAAGVTKDAVAGLHAARDSTVGGLNAAGLLTFDQWKAKTGSSDKSLYNSQVLSGGTKISAPGLTNISKNMFADTVVDANGKSAPYDPNDETQAAGLKNGTLTKKVNSSHLVVVDGDGNAQNPDATNLDQVIGLANGSLKLQQTTGPQDISKYDSNGKPIYDSGAGGGGDTPDAYAGKSVVPKSSLIPGSAATLQEYIDSKGDPTQLAAFIAADKAAGGVPLPKTNDAGVSSQGVYQFFGLSKDAQKLLTILPMPGNVPNSINNTQANTGYNGVTKNGAQPGTTSGPGGGN